VRRRRGEAEVSSVAEELLARVDPKGKRLGTVAATSWEKAAGPDIARHTHGMVVRHGELVVYVDSPTWANELSLMSEELRVRLNEELGKDLVTSMRFTVSRQVREERQREALDQEGAESAPEPAAPLSSAEQGQVEYVARTIEDNGLREAAVRAMTRSLEWKKGLLSRNGREPSDK
jgi:hypothetical protein